MLKLNPSDRETYEMWAMREESIKGSQDQFISDFHYQL